MRFVPFVIAFALAATASAQPAALDVAATSMTGMEASFTHRFVPKGFKTAQVERGTVSFGKLPAMRWNYTAPEQKLFVFDGATSWFYVPADKQVTVARVDDAKKRELPFLLLGDPAARDKHFTVRQQSSGGNIITKLTPRAQNATIREATVTSNAKTGLLQRIEYTDRQGNRTTFDFSGYRRSSAGAAAFRFTPPAGVQVVNAN